MLTYTCLITDWDLNEPVELVIFAQDEARARQRALHELNGNSNHQRVELREGARVCFVEERTSPPDDALHRVAEQRARPASMAKRLLGPLKRGLPNPTRRRGLPS